MPAKITDRPIPIYERPVLDAPCVPFVGAISSTGYGSKWRNGKVYSAHVLAYEDAYGPVPSGLYIDHLCENRPCIEPTHLEAVTNGENIRRSNRTCRRGHPFNRVNTAMTKEGTRRCRVCRRKGVR